MNKLIAILIIFGGLVVDQGTKYLVYQTVPFHSCEQVINFPLGEHDIDLLRICHTYNTGVAFGLFSGEEDNPIYRILFFIGFTLIAFVILLYFYMNVKKEERAIKICFLLIMSGALGNLFDRVFGHIIFEGEWKLLFGKVLDFINVGITDNIRWYTFNMADVFITMGVLIMFVILLTKRNKEIFIEKEKKE